MDARGIPLSSEIGAANVWATAIEEIAAHDKTTSLDLNFIRLPN